MATRNFTWPATVVSATNPSVGLTGQPAPTSATEIGGVDAGGDLIAVAVNPDGTIIIDSTLDKNFGVVGANTLRTAAEIGNATGPAAFNAGATGAQVLRTVLASDQAATLNQEATQLLVKADLDTIAAVDFATQTTLAAVNAKLNSLGQKNMAGSVPVVVASDQSDLPVVLKAGAAIIGKVAIDQTTPGTTNGVVVNSSALPTGASTSALQTTGNTSLASIDTKTPALGQAVMAASVPVVIASDQTPIPVTGTFTSGGLDVIAFARLDFSTSNVTSGAYTQIVASTTGTTKEIEVYTTSYQDLYLAIGGAGSEVNKMYIPPGGNGFISIAIPAASRLSLKAVTTDATSGYILINFLG